MALQTHFPCRSQWCSGIVISALVAMSYGLALRAGEPAPAAPVPVGTPAFSVVAMDAATLLRCQRQRSSSYDRKGGNDDCLTLAPGAQTRILDVRGARGAVTRLWFTLRTDEPDHLEAVRLTLAFDDVRTADRVPWGAFFATGPWRVNDVVSERINVMRARASNQDQSGTGLGSFNANWQMPFARSAAIDVENGTTKNLTLYYYVDYYTGPLVEADPFLFHVTHRRAAFTTPAPAGAPAGTGAHNHVFADIRDREGFYVGTVLTVESHPSREGKWYEGDDRFVIDGQAQPPALLGTGTEDYFAMAWGIHRSYQAFDHGVTHFEHNLTPTDRFYDGRFTLYRWHINDPIVFHSSLHASLEAGHANDCRQYYESTAFWYGRTKQ